MPSRQEPNTLPLRRSSRIRRRLVDRASYHALRANSPTESPTGTRHASIPSTRQDALYPGLNAVLSSAPKYSLREQYALYRFSRGLDLLHLPHYVIPLRSACPLVVTIHDLIHIKLPHRLGGVAQRYARFMLHQAARQAQRIITVSEHAAADICQELGVSRQKVTVIPNGIDECFHHARDGLRPNTTTPEILTRLGLRSADYILTVGNPRMPHKNLALLLRAYRLLCAESTSPPPVLIIAGGAPPPALRANLNDVLGEYISRVHFVGRITSADLPYLYARARVFVWPSLYEGFGLPPLEAMASGTAVVSSDASAMPEVLGQAAHYADPHDVRAWAQALALVLTNRSYRQRLVERGIRQAQRYRWPQHVASTLEVYDEVLRTTHRS